MSSDHPAITFVNFFCEKYLLAVYNYTMHGNDEKLKINEFGPCKFMQNIYG